MHKGMVVVLESTTYPGTTRELLLPNLALNMILKIGEDWFLAFLPSVWTRVVKIGRPSTRPR
jgi:UDP-N-acetyl-D-glucosamine dehydrogenase